MNVLALYAHPDDETMLAGGTLALLARLGARVHYLCATRGEGGEAGEPPLCEVSELGRLRESELRCAVTALGGASLELLDYIDPRVGPEDTLFAFSDDVERFIAETKAVIRRLDIAAVFTHGSNGEYGHPAHRFIHAAVHRAVLTLGAPTPLLYSTNAAYDGHPHPRLMNVDDPAHLILDLPAEALVAKTAAALCHRTQHALFVRRRSQEAGRPVSVPEAIHPVESLHRHLPPAGAAPLADPLAALLRSSGCVRPA